jgi:hypothetical protein
MRRKPSKLFPLKAPELLMTVFTKSFLFFLTLIFPSNIFISNSASAIEPCFVNVPDSAWDYISEKSPAFAREGSQVLGYWVSPVEVSEEINKSSGKDYVYKVVRQIKTPNNENWVDIQKVSNGVRLPLVPGDKYRNLITYEGRSCSPRTVIMKELVVGLGITPSVKEYAAKFSRNFQKENEVTSRFTTEFPIKLASQSVKMSTEYDIGRDPRILDFVINNSRETGPTIHFKDNCAKVTSGPFEKILPNTWRIIGMSEPKFIFTRNGVCTGEVFSHAFQGDLAPFLIGTLEFNVSEAKNSPVICVKGKLTKKVSGTNPKCPKGYKIKA